jgi:hypothetical protein
MFDEPRKQFRITAAKIQNSRIPFNNFADDCKITASKEFADKRLPLVCLW